MPDHLGKLKHLKPLVPRKYRPFLKKKLLNLQSTLAGYRDTKNSSNETLPFPPPNLRYRVHGSVDRESFITVGRRVAQNLRRLANNANIPIAQCKNVLDFGCGCGRVLRYLRQELANAKVYGADIDPEGIRWCRDNLPFGQFVLNAIDRQMDFPSGYFDFIYGISVFTHLDEGLQNIWLDELRRVSKSGAFIILTVHGDFAAQNALDSYALEKYRKYGFYFVAGTTGKYKLDGLPDFYQTAFHTQEYIERRWKEYFDIVDYIPRGINNHQDAVVVRRP